MSRKFRAASRRRAEASSKFRAASRRRAKASRIGIRSCAALLLAALPAFAEEKPVAVPQDLLAVLTLRGKPCGTVASHERKGESDYLVTCSDGHRYRVYIGPGDRVIVEDR
jgi:hypothetical protein